MWKKIENFFRQVSLMHPPQAEENYVIDERGNKEDVGCKLHQGH